jgi:hypothetical protein
MNRRTFLGLIGSIPLVGIAATSEKPLKSFDKAEWLAELKKKIEDIALKYVFEPATQKTMEALDNEMSRMLNRVAAPHGIKIQRHSAAYNGERIVGNINLVFPNTVEVVVFTYRLDPHELPETEEEEKENETD